MLPCCWDKMGWKMQWEHQAVVCVCTWTGERPFYCQRFLKVWWFGECIPANKLPFSHSLGYSHPYTQCCVPKLKFPILSTPTVKNYSLCTRLGVPDSQVDGWCVLAVSGNLLDAIVWVWWGFLFYFLILLLVCFPNCKLLMWSVSCYFPITLGYVLFPFIMQRKKGSAKKVSSWIWC